MRAGFSRVVSCRTVYYESTLILRQWCNMGDITDVYLNFYIVTDNTNTTFRKQTTKTRFFERRPVFEMSGLCNQ
jgi:hypothetical protein